MARKKKAEKAKLTPVQARREFLALRPTRNPDIEWEEVEDKATESRVVLRIPRPNDWRMKVLTVFLPPLDEEDRKKTVILDPLGSDVWRRCDGQTTIAQISEALQKGYKLNASEAELSLRQFFQTLGRRGYIAFAFEKK